MSRIHAFSAMRRSGMRFTGTLFTSMACCSIALMLSACGATPVPAQPDAPVPAPTETAAAPAPDVAVRPEREAAPIRTPVAAYRVVGTEPFWGIRIDGDALHFTTLEDQAGKRLTARPAVTTDGVRYEGEHEGVAFALSLARAACSDGMSDTEYTYTAAFRYGQQDYQGCAQPAE